jgi:hypothetical protein
LSLLVQLDADVVEPKVVEVRPTPCQWATVSNIGIGNIGQRRDGQQTQTVSFQLAASTLPGKPAVRSDQFGYTSRKVSKRQRYTHVLSNGGPTCRSTNGSSAENIAMTTTISHVKHESKVSHLKHETKGS